MPCGLFLISLHLGLIVKLETETNPFPWHSIFTTTSLMLPMKAPKYAPENSHNNIHQLLFLSHS